MTRLRSDSSSSNSTNSSTTSGTTNSSTTTSVTDSTTSSATSASSYGGPVIVECNIRPELQILQHQPAPTLPSSILIDSSSEDDTTDSDESSVIVVERQDLEDRQSSVGYSNFDVLDTEDDDDRERQLRNDTASSLLDEAVHEFGLTSVRRFSIGRDQGYSLRPNFAILKHKTENSDQDDSNQVSARRRFPKTPDWFFNIPDTRSPFPTFGSGLADDSD